MRNWREALRKADIDFPDDRVESNISCLFHSDKSPSLAINVSLGVWICYAGCGEGTIIELIARFLGITEMEASTYGYEPSLQLRLPSGELAQTSMPLVNIIGIPNRVPKWILERGFDKKTLANWECGECENSLIIPVKNAVQQNVGYVERKPKGILPKYKYSPGLKVSNILFGIDRINNPPFVCVTEGPLDTMWLWKCGFSSVALFTAHMSERQEELIFTMNTPEIVLCLDNDEVGQNATNEIAKRLDNRLYFSYTNIPEGYKDVQEMDVDSVIDMVNNRKTIRFKETQNMPSVNQIKKTMDDASTASDFRLLTLGNGDQAFVTIVHDGKDEEDLRLDAFHRHVFEVDNKYSYPMCERNHDDPCDWCANKVQRQRRFGMWVYVHFVDHDHQNDNGDWKPVKKDMQSAFREDIKEFRMCVLPFGKNGIVWEQLSDILTDKGVLNKNIVRIRRVGEKLETNYLIRTTDTAGKVFSDEPTLEEECVALPGVVEYLSGLSRSRNTSNTESTSDNGEEEPAGEVVVSDNELEDLF